MDRINIGPDELETFVAVAELASFRGAARRLGISQPSVSSRIQRLECVLGVVLFNRTTRRVVLTEPGQRLYLRAQHTVSDLRSIVQELRSESRLQRGRISIAAAASVAATVLPSCIRHFSRRYPGVKLNLSDWFDNTPLDLLREELADIAVVNLNERSNDLRFEPLFSDEILVVVPRNHPLANVASADLATIAKYPFLSQSSRSPTFAMVEQIFCDHGLRLNKVLETRSLLMLIGLVEAGLGLTVLPRVVTPRLNLDMVNLVKVRDIELVRQIGIVTLRDRSPSRAASAFINVLRTACRSGMTIS